MREIKFRAWDEENKQFILAELFPRLEEPFMGRMENGASAEIKHTAPKKLEWQQFTGLRDRNGKEIYEGDVIKYENRTTEIKFGKHEFGNYLGFYPDDNYTPNWGMAWHWEVIGNIYENPELLKD